MFEEQSTLSTGIQLVLRNLGRSIIVHQQQYHTRNVIIIIELDYLLFYVTVDNISVKYVTANRCA